MATHKAKFLKRVGEDASKSFTLAQLARISGVSVADLREIKKRGQGAWRTNPTSVRMRGTYKKNVVAPRSQKLSATQWGIARVYAFLNKRDEIKAGKRKRIDQDPDIMKKYL